MNELINQANQLAKDISLSDEYKNYLFAKEKLLQNKQIYEGISDYKKKNMDYQIRCLNGETVSFDEEKIISGIFWELMLNEDARRFIETERKLLQLTEKINEIISEGYEILTF